MTALESNTSIRTGCSPSSRPRHTGAFEAVMLVESVIGIACLALFLVPFVVGVRPMVVMSGSMEPAIPTGAVAYVNTHAANADIKEGDIACYEAPNGKLVMHRVSGESSDGMLVFKGDANSQADADAVGRDRIVGVHLAHIPVLGYVGAWIQANFAAFALALCGLNAAAWLVDYAIRRSKDRRRKEWRQG